MRTSAKLSLAALMAALLLASAVSTSSARNLEVSNQNIRVTWTNLEFIGFVTIRCQVTLEGSFHARTITKSVGTLVGAVTRVDIKNETCTNGTAVVRNLPWHITYEGFAGTLPNITQVFLLLSRFLFQVTARLTGTRCEIGTGNITGSAAINGSREVTTLTPVAGRNVGGLLNPGGEPFGCTSGQLNGVGTVTQLNSSTRIRVTLI